MDASLAQGPSTDVEPINPTNDANMSWGIEDICNNQDLPIMCNNVNMYSAAALDNTSTPLNNEDYVFSDENGSTTSVDDDEKINGEYTKVTRNRATKRKLVINSPNSTIIARPTKRSNLENRDMIIFMKAKTGNISQLNPIKLKIELLKIDKSLQGEQICYNKENIKILCESNEQKSSPFRLRHF